MFHPVITCPGRDEGDAESLLQTDLVISARNAEGHSWRSRRTDCPQSATTHDGRNDHHHARKKRNGSLEPVDLNKIVNAIARAPRA